MIDYSQEISYYLESKNVTGGLLLTGKWGSGKSYCIKEYRDAHRDKYAIAVVSMFGIRTVAELHQKVKEEYLSFVLGVNVDNVEKTLDVGKRITGIANETVGKVSKIKAPIPPAVQGATSLVAAVDLYAFVDVKNTLRKDRRFVLVFDDFERSSIPMKERIGLINYYVESKDIKTIIVADEDRITSDVYIEFKEKAISRTLHYSCVPKDTIEMIINAFDTDNHEYIRFVENNIGEFIAAFEDSGYDNYRTFKSCVSDYERIYDSWISKNGIEIGKISGFIYEFCARLYEAKAGKYVQREYPNSFVVMECDDDAKKTIKDKYREGSFTGDFYSVSNWIVNGEWDDLQFGNELLKKYVFPIKSSEDRVLEWTIYELEQEDIDKGIPLLLNKAYRGDLSRNDLIPLLHKLFILEDCGVNMPCQVDYSRIEAGFEKRCERIKSAEITEPACFRIVEDAWIDSRAYALNAKINALDEKLVYWENRRRFIEAFESGTLIDLLDLRKYSYEEFDSAMKDAFLEKFRVASNYQRKEYSDSMIACSYLTMQSDVNNLENTVNNLEIIKNEFNITLDEKKKSISDIATIEFIRKLDLAIDRYKEELSRKRSINS